MICITRTVLLPGAHELTLSFMNSSIVLTLCILYSISLSLSLSLYIYIYIYISVTNTAVSIFIHVVPRLVPVLLPGAHELLPLGAAGGAQVASARKGYCLYVCMYVCMYVCVYIHIYIYIYIYIYVASPFSWASCPPC